MHSMHLSAVDANLFVVMRALLRTQSVTQASRQLGLSASATSHALARLRATLGDPLLVRVGRRLVPTPRALAIEATVGNALDALEAALVPPRPVEPATLDRAYRIKTTDHVQFVLLRALDRRLRREAPHVNLYMRSLAPETFDRM